MLTLFPYFTRGFFVDRVDDRMGSDLSLARRHNNPGEERMKSKSTFGVC